MAVRMNIEWGIGEWGQKNKNKKNGKNIKL